MKWHKLSGLVIMTIAVLVLFGATQSFAAVGTEAGTNISNTASVSFELNSVPTSVSSPPAEFLVDRKIRPVVTNLSGTNVIAGGSDYALPFTVTNQSNTKAAETDHFNLTIAIEGGNDFDMDAPVRLYRDVNANGILDAGDGLPLFSGLGGSYVESTIGNTDDGTNLEYYIIVADTPAAGGTPDTGVAGFTSQYHLIATASDAGGTTLTPDGDGNDAATEEIVFADDAGSVGGDNSADATHSAVGTFTTIAPISLDKEATTPAYFIPGAEVLYNVTVFNNDATYNAASVILLDAVPPNTTYNAGSLNCPASWTRECSNNGTTGPWVADCDSTGSNWAVRCDGGVNEVNKGGGSASMKFTVNID